jgi:hypothetical protein
MSKERDEWLDETRDLKIQAWRCVSCRNGIEQISLQPALGRSRAQRIRYAVRASPVVTPSR